MSVFIYNNYWMNIMITLHIINALSTSIFQQGNLKLSVEAHQMFNWVSMVCTYVRDLS